MLHLQAIRCSRLLPSLHQECTSRDSVVSALPPLLSLIQHSSSEEFTEYVFPEVTFVFNCSKPEQVTISINFWILFFLSKVFTLLSLMIYSFLSVEISFLSFFFEGMGVGYNLFCIMLYFIISSVLYHLLGYLSYSGDLLLLVGVRRRASCAVRRASSVNIFFSGTTGPILTKFSM